MLPTDDEISNWLNQNKRSYQQCPLDEVERLLVADVLKAIVALQETKKKGG